MDIKKILPIELNYALWHIGEWVKKDFPECSEELLRNSKRVFFLDTPAYGNIGDQAIAYAMELFLADTLPDYAQIEVTEDALPSCLRWLKKTIRKEDIICLTGGGNMGVMYQRYEAVRRLVIRTFPENPIVIFPQTFDYESDSYSKRERRRAELLYGRAKNLIVCARDEESFKQMKKSFSNATVIFCPDIALYLEYQDHFVRDAQVGVCLRNDRERVLPETEKQGLLKNFPGYQELTTADDTFVPISNKNRKMVVEKKLHEFGTKSLIITDRLHGMIFAYITNTPCIALPNSNGKVERVSRYLSTSGNIQFLKGEFFSLSFAQQGNGSVRGSFSTLVDAIRKSSNS